MMKEFINGDGVGKMGVVAFLGPPSSYSHQVRFTDKTSSSWTALYLVSLTYIPHQHFSYTLFPFPISLRRPSFKVLQDSD
jgi:hypothetical protein